MLTQHSPCFHRIAHGCSGDFGTINPPLWVKYVGILESVCLHMTCKGGYGIDCPRWYNVLNSSTPQRDDGMLRVAGCEDNGINFAVLDV